MNDDALADATMGAVVAMLEQDPEKYGDAIGDIIAGGPADVTAAVNGWAAVVQTVMIQAAGHSRPAGWGLTGPDGHLTGPPDATPAQTAALQILVDHLTGNQEDPYLLIRAEFTRPTPDRLVEVMTALVQLAALTAQLALAEVDAYGPPWTWGELL